MFKITENRNIGAISEEEQAVLGSKTVFVAGCGGLGCYCADMLSRLGVGHLVLCDCDEFEPSNINRQLYCNVKTMGKNKAVVASQQINQQRLSKVITYPTPITKLNAYDIIQNCDLVIDCLDNIPTRFILQKACEKRGIPMVTGGVSHWHSRAWFRCFYHCKLRSGGSRQNAFGRTYFAQQTSDYRPQIFLCENPAT